MRQVNTRHYAEQIAARYPELDPEDIYQVCSYTMLQLYGAIANKRFDVAIQDKNRNLKLKFYKRDYNLERCNLTAKKKAKRLRLIRSERALSTSIKKHFK